MTILAIGAAGIAAVLLAISGWIPLTWGLSLR